MRVCLGSDHRGVQIKSRLMQSLQQNGFEVIDEGTYSDDPVDYPDDSMANMRRVGEKFGFPFPYLMDVTQEVARAYGAVCTPDFFGYNADLELQYRGRLDAAGSRMDLPDQPRELFMAMKQVAETGRGPEEQVASMGCSIKWRDA